MQHACVNRQSQVRILPEQVENLLFAALATATGRTLQKQEEAREMALQAFHDMIAARAVQAGAAAVAENKSRQEREERLVAASEAKAKSEAEVGLC